VVVVLGAASHKSGALRSYFASVDIDQKSSFLPQLSQLIDELIWFFIFTLSLVYHAFHISGFYDPVKAVAIVKLIFFNIYLFRYRINSI
jgi:hypothetical protein